MASLVAVAGRLADFVPAGRLLRLGLVIFLMTSVAAGLSPNVGWLIAVRAVQGMSAALIFTSSVVLIGQVFADDERGRAFGIFSSLVTVLILIGPFAGGLLTEYVSWRMLGSTLSISIGSALLSATGVTWPIFLVMALALAFLRVIAYAWLERSPPHEARGAVALRADACRRAHGSTYPD